MMWITVTGISFLPRLISRSFVPWVFFFHFFYITVVKRQFVKIFFKFCCSNPTFFESSIVNEYINMQKMYGR